MTTQTERKGQINKIRNFPAELNALLAKYPESRLDTPVRSGEWTIRQIVHHLADAHMVALARMKLVLTETKPIIKPYDQDAWSTLADAKLPLGPSLAILGGVHERWAEMLSHVTDTEWERTGVHLERGLITLDGLLSMYAGHCQTHLDQIKQLPAK
jgi:hypothetical protein